MSREDVIHGLRDLARRTEFARRAAQASVDLMRPEYEVLFANDVSASEEFHQKALDLYPWVIEEQRRADQLAEERDLFLKAVEMLG